MAVGCGRQSDPAKPSPQEPPAAAPNHPQPGDSQPDDSNQNASAPGASTSGESAPGESAGEIKPASYEFSADDLLGMRLAGEEASQGWLRLFDGHTLFGWEITGQANWRVEQGTIVVDRGQPCLLCTSMPWQDYELELEFHAGPGTNSGVFLRTPLQPEDPATDCYEVNIAPDENAYPTGGVVKRQKADPQDPQSYDKWRTMKIRLDGRQLDVTVDGVQVCRYVDQGDLMAGRIGLQHNSGPVAFRNIRVRPLGLETLLDVELSQWKKYPDMPGEFSVTEEGWLHVQGGRNQLETKESSYDDFVLLAEYKLPREDMNSGIFFRCIPGDEMMGYECQLSNEMKDGKPLVPADCGTGGIFRRQDARLIAGEAGQWATVVLVARGTKMAAWVNGIQVSDWEDDRPPHENPRKGRRTEAGTIMIQGHDPGTDALLRQISIAKMTKAN
ncbi:MAG: DUF1080 domain-containing protein [Pirellulales bacterium]|nr:DUF1080 domain-containing protein [Pirellulales bacterium]